MTHWNYRVIVRDGRFAVHSVYYAKDGRITAFSAEPSVPSGESFEALAADLERFRQALAEAVLDFGTLETAVEREAGSGT